MNEDFLPNEDDSLDILASDNTNLQRYLTFLCDGLTYAIDTAYVIEIITNYSITVLPMVPNYVTGIINLRGGIVPIIDIRARMGGSYSEKTETTCIIVLDVHSTTIGMIVDAVSQVVDIDQTLISSMPSNNRQELVDGMTNLNEDTTVLFLNCELLVNNQELAL